MPTWKNILELNTEVQECEKNLAFEWERYQNLKQDIKEYRIAILARVQKSSWDEMIRIVGKKADYGEEEAQYLIEEMFEL